MVSTELKSVLKKIGIDPKIVRRVAISTYEGEMNVVMHAIRARVHSGGHTAESIEVVINDEGKGIPGCRLGDAGGIHDLHRRAARHGIRLRYGIAEY